MDKALNIICILVLFSHNIFTTAYTLTPSQSISYEHTLISQGGKFELGFFNPSPSQNWYLGIWYKTIPVQTVVWVANREAPVPDTSGVMKIDKTGNIVILNKTESVIWSSNSSKAVENPIVEFLESGNLVIREAGNGDPDSYIWQSFDYPGNTLLPGMKWGWNLQTRTNKYLSSWRNSSDPSRGDFTFGIELGESPETVMWKGSHKYYHGGSQNLGKPDVQPFASIFTYDVVRYSEEIYIKYTLVNQSTVVRFVLVQSGNEGRFEITKWDGSTWSPLVTLPNDNCDKYAVCGVYETCDVRYVEPCQCLPGFTPISPKNWKAKGWSEGCKRVVPLNCTNKEDFIIQRHVKVPYTTNAWSSTTVALDECRLRCLKNCSCMAYSNINVIGGGSGCVMWFTDLIDIRQFQTGGQDLYIRIAASELGAPKDSQVNSTRKKILTTTASVVSFVAILLIGFASRYVWKKRALKGGIETEDLDLPLYTFATITAATNNFSAENKLGEGGFGPVYKGKLEEGQEIAVKRLSKESTQGVVQFKNEVMLISKLQHINLVRLLGCCIEGEEKMLVYEYMPNSSLDASIFDMTKRRQLDWQKLFQIIRGIAAGLQYLHYDSRLKIIHRDLKAGNILLDSKMVPKISDFGMARIFGGDQVAARTKRVVGTYGYMSPEYLIEGHFSEKSDVFGFGVIVLEIISGMKNWGFRHLKHELNLLGHAWTLCNEDKCLEFADESLRSSTFVQDVIRCIHIGLLCVQKEIDLRPTMSSVVTMLSSETVALPRPHQPGFYVERIPIPSYNNNKHPRDINDYTITLFEGR